MLKEQCKESQDKLSKAKAVRANLNLGYTFFADCFQFIKSQDKLFKEEQAKKGGGVGVVS